VVRTTVDVGASRRVQMLEKAAMRWSATRTVHMHDCDMIDPRTTRTIFVNLEPITWHEAHAQLIDSTIVCVCA
jgi:hypothetical protein